MPRGKQAKSKDHGKEMNVVKAAGVEPVWLQDMQAHFARTGQYRPNDLTRVLGDQRTVVGPRDNNDQISFALKK